MIYDTHDPLIIQDYLLEPFLFTAVCSLLSNCHHLEMTRRSGLVLTPTMSITKVKLKAAREAISRQDYPTACDAAQQVLEYEPNDYHAYVASPHPDPIALVL